MSKTTMTKAEREAFLAEPRVGVFSVTEPERGPLSIPVWFHYEPGGVVRFTTGGGSKKAKLMRASGRASLLVQKTSNAAHAIPVAKQQTRPDSSAPSAERCRPPSALERNRFLPGRYGLQSC